MSVSPPTASGEFVDAVVARDFPRARGMLDDAIDFRAMTPSRVWEADTPGDVEQVLRAWFEHRDRDVDWVEAMESGSVADTRRVGWRVGGTDTNGAFAYEQLAFVRESEGRIVWLRVMCSGPRPC